MPGITLAGIPYFCFLNSNKVGERKDGRLVVGRTPEPWFIWLNIPSFRYNYPKLNVEQESFGE